MTVLIICALLLAALTAFGARALSQAGYRRPSYFFAVLLPLCFLALYLYLGTPDQPSTFAKIEPPSVRTELRALMHEEAQLRIEAARDAENPARWIKLGTTQMVLEKTENAVESLKKAHALNPKNETARAALGAALFAQGIQALDAADEKAAQRLFKQALDIAPKSAPYYGALKNAVRQN